MQSIKFEDFPQELILNTIVSLDKWCLLKKIIKGNHDGDSVLKITHIFALVTFMLTNLSSQELLPNSPMKVRPIPVGSNIPAVILTTIDNEPFDLLAAVKSQPTILIYYRGGW